jgi:hypothetical protein
MLESVFGDRTMRSLSPGYNVVSDSVSFLNACCTAGHRSTKNGLFPNDWKPMARKTNYGFERREREKARAQKKADRQRAKQEKSNERKDAPVEDRPADQ